MRTEYSSSGARMECVGLTGLLVLNWTEHLEELSAVGQRLD